MRPVLIETCAASALDVINSEKAGADRAELNSCLYVGGLTPSLGSLILAKEKTKRIRIMTMLRPRHGGFCYSEEDFLTMQRDADLFLEHGADGLVFGFLDEKGRVDEARVRALVRLAGSHETVFHRAFDVVPDWKDAMERLIDCGVTRVLTSGQKKTALEGRFLIRDMMAYAKGRIQILPGAGIRPDNMQEILDVTGCTELHMSSRAQVEDPSLSANAEIRFTGSAALDEQYYQVIRPDRLPGQLSPR